MDWLTTSVMPFDESSVSEVLFRHKSEIAAAGYDPLALLYDDPGIRMILDNMPVEDAVLLIPSLCGSLAIRDAENFFDLLKYGLGKSQIKITPSGIDEMDKRYANLNQEQLLKEHEIIYGYGIDLPDIREIPPDIMLIKAINPDSVAASLYDAFEYETIQIKMTRRPLVVSSYTGDMSATYYGVGLIYGNYGKNVKLVRCFPSDIGSMPTTPNTGPKLSDHKDSLQLVNWDGVRKCSDVNLASNLNSAFWHTELWLNSKKPIRPTAVFVRNYSTYVDAGKHRGYKTDNSRALAAVILARNLDNLPIIVLP